MPVETAPLPRDHLGEVIGVVLTLKEVGASNNLVKIALDNAHLPEQVKKTAALISDGIQGDYSSYTRYQRQQSYPSD